MGEFGKISYFLLYFFFRKKTFIEHFSTTLKDRKLAVTLVVITASSTGARSCKRCVHTRQRG